MFTIELEGHTIKIYKTAEELPIKRYARFQRYCIIDAGVGSDMQSVNTHFGKLFEYLIYNKSEDALQETKNLYYNFYTILEEIPIKGMAFACLIHSIDGQEIVDTSEDALKLVVETLSDIGLTAGYIKETIEELKKKFHKELKKYAPSFFSNEDTYKFYQKVKDKISAIEKMVSGTGSEKELFEINRFFVEFSKPSDFDTDSEYNEVLKVDTTFEHLCAVLEGNGVAGAADLTAMKFYLRLEYFKKVNSRAQDVNIEKPVN